MILDTNAVSALLSGDQALARALSDAGRHELPVIVIGEYRYGLRRSTKRATLEPLLDRLITESNVLAVTDATTHHYATVRHRLRDAGTPIPENDVWISALALQHGASVVSRDRHFDLVAGVARIDW